MSKRFEPIQPAVLTWQNGVPCASQFNDIYFSNENGLEESRHVFMDGNDLTARFRALDERSVFVIAELGFGTGLNCLLAWQLFLAHAPKNAKLVIYSAEKHPLVRDDLHKALSLWPELAREATLLIDAYPVLTPGMHTLQLDDGRVVLNLMLQDALRAFQGLLVCGKSGLEEALRPWQVDAWFLDGFSPDKNPALWSSDLFNVLGLLSHTDTTIATFSAAGEVRRGLEAAGFKVSKRQGFGQKKHCLSGELSAAPASIHKPYTPWAMALPSKKQKQQVIVVGAGLAGCFTAHALSMRGFQVTVLDAESHFARGASGVRQAVLYPHLSAYQSPLSVWMLQAFLFATRAYGKWLKGGMIRGELKGLLQFDFKRRSLKPWLAVYPELGRFVDAKTASILAGVTIEAEALFVPGAGWVDAHHLCHFLMNKPGIDWQPSTAAHALAYEKGSWHVAGFDAPVVVLANGGAASAFLETKHLPLEQLRGQMTAVQSNNASKGLKLPLCGSGHVLPMNDNIHWVGASYHGEALDSIPNEKDDAANLMKLAALPLQDMWSHKVIDAWAGIRAKTPDYLPLVGPVPDILGFQTQFSDLLKDGRRLIEKPGVYHPGLYVCAGFGSRGLTSIPLAAEHLASVIAGEPACLSQPTLDSIAPARFLVKQLKQGVL